MFSLFTTTYLDLSVEFSVKNTTQINVGNITNALIFFSFSILVITNSSDVFPFRQYLIKIEGQISESKSIDNQE